MLSLAFPNIDPYIIRFGELGVTWYSLSYVVGLFIGLKYSTYLAQQNKLTITKQHLDDFLTWAIIGIIVGGRLGYVLAYDLEKHLNNPITILQTYKGGMSFHGGLMGVGVAAYLFCRFRKIPFFEFTDLISVVAPIGIMLGRIANFINGELFGRATNLPWGIVFPYGGPEPRHPSQLYEAFAEGVILVILLSYLALRKKALRSQKFLTGCFLTGYGLGRFICEFFREPDIHIGYLSYGSTMGQILTLPMILGGIYFLKASYDHPKLSN